jgi:hypothetical protein
MKPQGGLRESALTEVSQVFRRHSAGVKAPTCICPNAGIDRYETRNEVPETAPEAEAIAAVNAYRSRPPRA